METPPLRPWRRLHWWTWGVALALAGGLGWAQLIPVAAIPTHYTRNDRDGPGRVIQVDFQYGWPLAWLQRTHDLRANLAPRTYVWTGPSQYNVRIVALSVNVALSLLLIAVAMAVVEAAYRRHWINGIALTAACAGAIWFQTTPRLAMGTGDFRVREFGEPLTYMRHSLEVSPGWGWFGRVPQTVVKVDCDWRRGPLAVDLMVSAAAAAAVALVVDRWRRAWARGPHFGMRTLLMMPLVAGTLLAVCKHWFAGNPTVPWHQVAFGMCALACAAYLAFATALWIVSHCFGRMRGTAIDEALGSPVLNELQPRR